MKIEMKKLLSVSEIINSSVKKYEGERAYLKTGNLNDSGSFTLENFLYEDKPSRANQNVKVNDIIFARMENTKKVLLIDEAKEDIIVSTGFVVLRIDKSIIDPVYLYHVINSKMFQRQKNKYCKGATQKAINNQGLSKIMIPVPDIESQKRIADSLNKAIVLINKRKESIEKLDKLVQVVFLEMFGDPAINIKKFDRAMLIKACENKDDIRCGPFGTQLHATEFVNSGIPLWGIKHVNKHFKVPTDEYVSFEKAERLKNYKLLAGDLVMTRKGTVGNCSIYPPNYPEGIMHSDLLRIRVNSKVLNPTFLMYQLKLSRDIEHQLSRISTGAIMKGLNVTKLKEIYVLIPPLHLQNKFERFIKNIEDQKTMFNLSFEELTKIYYSLTEHAFKGELIIQEKLPNA